jgi:hypothetical protein
MRSMKPPVMFGPKPGGQSIDVARLFLQRK